MTTKEAVIEMIRRLPDDVSVDDIMEELYVRLQIEESMRELDDGKGIPHEEVMKRMAKWLE